MNNLSTFHQAPKYWNQNKMDETIVEKIETNRANCTNHASYIFSIFFVLNNFLKP